MSEIFISVDIETSGPIVARHSLLSIGACLTHDTSRTFSRLVIPISDATEPAAMAIVGKQISYFSEQGTSPAAVFTDFATWLHEVANDARKVFVGFNAAYDWSFVHWYFLTYVGENPFDISPLDIKAYYAGFAGVDWEATRSSNIPDKFKPIREHTHDALADAIEQAMIFERIRAAAECPVSSTPLEPQSALQDRLKSLKKSANLQASAHSMLRDHYAFWNFWLTLGALIPTAGLLCLALVTDDFALRALRLSPDEFKLFNVSVALFAFVCVLIQLVWKPDSREAAHARAVEHYTATKFEVRRILDESDIIDPTKANVIEEKYLETHGLPPIRDARFLSLKRRHLRKVDLSRRLDADPWMQFPRLWERPKKEQ